MPKTTKQKSPKKKISETVPDYDVVTAFLKGRTAQSISYSSIKKPSGTVSLFTKSGENLGTEFARLETVNKNQIIFLKTDFHEKDLVERIALSSNPLPLMDFKFQTLNRSKIREYLVVGLRS